MTSGRSNSARRYVKTRSFGKLNGRAVSPGSEYPENYFFRRRIVLIVIGIALAIPGVWALLT